MAKKYSSRARSRKPITLLERKKRKVEQLARESNKRLSKIKDKDLDLWAVNKLRARSTGKLNIWSGNKSNKINVSKLKNKEEIEGAIKSLEMFLSSETSTKRGIEIAKRNVREGIRQLTNASDETIDKIYDFINDKNFKRLREKDVDGSEIFIFMKNSIEANDSEETFLRRVSDYIDFGNDKDMKSALQEVYKGYIA